VKRGLPKLHFILAPKAQELPGWYPHQISKVFSQERKGLFITVVKKHHGIPTPEGQGGGGPRTKRRGAGLPLESEDLRNLGDAKLPGLQLDRPSRESSAEYSLLK